MRSCVSPEPTPPAERGRRLIGWGIGLSLVCAALVTMAPRVALADCPGGWDDESAAAINSAVTATGIRADIGWAKGELCGSGVSHSVTVCSNSSCDGFVQVGWRYYTSFNKPKSYCERKPDDSGTGTYQIHDHALTTGTHLYSYGQSATSWRCLIDGNIQTEDNVTFAFMGFSQGTSLVVQGEAHAEHGQIGRQDPKPRLSLKNVDYRATAGTWTNLILGNPVVSGGPYGADRPAWDRLRVWTNEDH